MEGCTSPVPTWGWKRGTPWPTSGCWCWSTGPRPLWRGSTQVPCVRNASSSSLPCPMTCASREARCTSMPGFGHPTTTLPRTAMTVFSSIRQPQPVFRDVWVIRDLWLPLRVTARNEAVQKLSTQNKAEGKKRQKRFFRQMRR